MVFCCTVLYKLFLLCDGFRFVLCSLVGGIIVANLDEIQKILNLCYWVNMSVG